MSDPPRRHLAQRQHPVAIGAVVRPHQVAREEVVVDDHTLVTAVDHKQKRTMQLQRLENIRADARVTVLVDHYDDDWNQLWWVRLQGLAEVIEAPSSVVLEPLVQKYEQYRSVPPAGPAIVVTIVAEASWSAQSPSR